MASTAGTGELGYENGRATALVEAQSASIPGNAARALRGRLADLLGDTEAEYSDVVLALLATLHATVLMARGEHTGDSPNSPVLQS